MTGADPADPAEALARYGSALAGGLEAALPGWVVSSVTRVVTAWSGSVPPEVAAAAEEAGRRAAAEVGPVLRELLATDIDDQHTTPLAVLRDAVRYPTGVLVAAGVPAVPRDSFAVSAFPADRYGLSPASVADIDPDLAEVGLAWGAAKAFVHRRRHLG